MQAREPLRSEVHETLIDLRVACEHALEGGPRHSAEPRIAERADGRRPRAPCQDRNLADAIAGCERRKNALRSVVGFGDDLNLALRDHVKMVSWVALMEQDLRRVKTSWEGQGAGRATTPTRQGTVAVVAGPGPREHPAISPAGFRDAIGTGVPRAPQSSP